MSVHMSVQMSVHMSMHMGWQVEEVDIFVLTHDRFGQKEMKEAGCSPDAFVQMAMQLAYYRDCGGFCQTSGHAHATDTTDAQHTPKTCTHTYA